MADGGQTDRVAAIEKLLTADEVSAILKVEKAWVYRAARDGRLPSIPIGRYVRFRRESIEAWGEVQR